MKEELQKNGNSNFNSDIKKEEQILEVEIKEDLDNLENSKFSNKLNLEKEEFDKLNQCHLPKFEEMQINQKDKEILCDVEDIHKEKETFERNFLIIDANNKAENSVNLNIEIKDSEMEFNAVHRIEEPEMELNAVHRTEELEMQLNTVHTTEEPEMQFNALHITEEPLMREIKIEKEINQKVNQEDDEKEEKLIKLQLFEKKIMRIEATDKTEVEPKTDTQDFEIYSKNYTINEEPLISNIINENKIKEKEFQYESKKDERTLKSHKFEKIKLIIESTNNLEIKSEKIKQENEIEDQIKDSPILGESVIGNSDQGNISSLKHEKEETLNINKDKLFEKNNNSEIYDNMIQHTDIKENNFSRIDLTESICLNEEKNAKSGDDIRINEVIEIFSDFKNQEISFDKIEGKKMNKNEKLKNENKELNKVNKNEANIQEDKNEGKINEVNKSDEKEINKKNINYQIISNEEREGNNPIKKNFSYNKYLFLFLSSGFLLTYYLFRNRGYIKNAFDKFGFIKKH